MCAPNHLSCRSRPTLTVGRWCGKGEDLTATTGTHTPWLKWIWWNILLSTEFKNVCYIYNIHFYRVQSCCANHKHFLISVEETVSGTKGSQGWGANMELVIHHLSLSLELQDLIVWYGAIHLKAEALFDARDKRPRQSSQHTVTLVAIIYGDR